MNSLAILWAQYGPYHFARAAALQKLAAPATVHAVELANRSSDYGWSRSGEVAELITICSGAEAERLPFWQVFHRARRTFADLKIGTCLLPGYAPKQSLAALLAARSLGLVTVMMNESHAGTARAGLAGTWVKRRLVAMFGAALVGGQPQKRYFASLGLPEEKIFTGYDAVDNEYFGRRAIEVRNRQSRVRDEYHLPDHYFLSLGRFVAKKNLAVLIHAYHKFRLMNPLTQTHLIMVGSGDEGTKLRSLCQELCLQIYDHSASGAATAKLQTPGVHFYGFRQIEENPVFYALADAFILPSLREEWGLVVNEAMGSGLPVVVSKTAGCAEDLLELCESLDAFPPQMGTQIAKAGLKEKVRMNGFVFNPDSSEELGRVMLVLDTLPGLRSLMGQASRRIIEKVSCENFARNAMLAVTAATNSLAARGGGTASLLSTSKNNARHAGSVSEAALRPK